MLLGPDDFDLSNLLSMLRTSLSSTGQTNIELFTRCSDKLRMRLLVEEFCLDIITNINKKVIEFF